MPHQADFAGGTAVCCQRVAPAIKLEEESDAQVVEHRRFVFKRLACASIPSFQLLAGLAVFGFPCFLADCQRRFLAVEANLS